MGKRHTQKSNKQSLESSQRRGGVKTYGRHKRRHILPLGLGGGEILPWGTEQTHNLTVMGHDTLAPPWHNIDAGGVAVPYLCIRLGSLALRFSPKAPRQFRSEPQGDRLAKQGETMRKPGGNERWWPFHYKRINMLYCLADAAHLNIKFISTSFNVNFILFALAGRFRNCQEKSWDTHLTVAKGDTMACILTDCNSCSSCDHLRWHPSQQSGRFPS
jgi:hypothetical protein